MTEERISQLFNGLVFSFQMQGMIQLGKLKNPMTDKIEKDLESAQTTVDMLEMLKVMTKNNLSEDEGKFLEQVLADLKLNYIQEINSPEPKSPDTNSPETKDKKE
jgi:hypothetical protein